MGSGTVRPVFWWAGGLRRAWGGAKLPTDGTAPCPVRCDSEPEVPAR
ncbi:MAG TPA: hypothetical protein VIR27_16390 [Mycobacteriales bacterium]